MTFPWMRSKRFFAGLTLLLYGWEDARTQSAPVAVTLLPSASPSSGQPGVTSISVTGSNFPAGTILPASVTVILTPASGGGAVSTTASAVATVIGSTRRVTFTIPASIQVAAPTAYNVGLSGTSSSGAAFASSNSASLTINPEAMLTTIVPNAGQQGQQNLTVTLTGQLTNFSQGSTQASFGPGIAVAGAAEGGFGPVTVVNATTATASLNIDPNATLGLRTITVQTGVQQVSFINGFTVQPGNSPIITTVSPASGQPGQTLTGVMVTGSSTHFTQGTPTVTFSLTGLTASNIQVTNDTHLTLTLTIAANAAVSSSNITVVTGAETASGTGLFSVTTSPTITDFNPKSAPIGTLVTVTGTNLQPNAGTAVQVMLAKQSGGTLTAGVSSAGATSLTFVIPAGAATGPLTVAVNRSSATASSPLTVTASSSFTLSVLPGSANLIQGQSAAYAISLASTTGFNQLSALSLAGLPAGVTAAFQPQQITTGQTSVLTLTAPAGQATGSSSLTVTVSATVNGLAVTQSASVTLNVQAVTTALLGRTVVSDSPETPLAGVTITMLGLDGNGNKTGCMGTTISDGAGNFALTNLSSLCTGPQLVGYNGTTATSPAGTYAGVNLVYTLVSGQAMPAPVLIHLPRIDNQETFLVQQNSTVDQSYSYKTIPNLSVTVYAGTTFTMPDGTVPNPFPLTAINVPPDRLPDIKPPVPTMITAFIVAFQPANATTNQPVAVYYPNPLNTAPGMDMALLTLDPTHGAMVPYGTGAVSADGTQIVPDLDPSHSGHRYGLVHFDWHLAGYPTPNGTNPCPICPIAEAGGPVDLSSGLAVVRETDISFGGARGTIALQRIYRSGAFDLGVPSGVPGSLGPFGYGTNHNFGYALATTAPGGASVINLIMPDGNQFPFSKQSNGSFVNSGIPSMAGAVMTVESDNTSVDLRWKDGTIFRFVIVFVAPYRQELLDSITDPNGNKIQISRNGFGITDIIDPVGRDLHFNLNGNGLITQITAPDGTSVSYSYDDGSGPLRVVTHPDGTTTRYDYNGSEDLTAETDGRGVVVASNTYDANRRVISQTQANGGVLQFSYTLQNPSAPLTSPVMSTTVTDALGHQTGYRFSPNQALISVTDALGRLRTFGRDGANNVTSITGAATCAACGDSTAGNQTFSYDGSGNLLSQTDALGNTTSFAYDPTFNKVTSVKDPLGNATTFTYDSLGNLLTQTDANHNTTSYQHDSFGELIASVDPLSATTHFLYDTFGNVISIQDPLSNTTSFQYDINGRLLVTQDALGRRTTLAYDNANRIISQTNAQNALTQFAYDQVGNLLTVTDPRSQKTSFTYDAMNGLKARTDPLGRVDTRSYDLNENLMSFTDRRGQTNIFTYDIVDRLAAENYQDGSTVARSYDANDRLVSVNDSAGGDFTFTYDLAGRLTGSATPNGGVQYTRDGLGRATSRQSVGQAAVSYVYDPAGNLTSAAMPSASASFQYDPRNLLSKITRMNGVSSAYAYDPLWRLNAITHANGVNLIDSESYGYDAVGNRMAHSTSIGQPSATQAVGSATYDGDDEQNQFGSTTNTFDANGNLVSSANSSGTSGFTWDSRNRLKSIVTSAGQVTNFTYDFTGELIQQADAGPTLTLTKSFLLDDLTNVAYETANDGTSYSVLSSQSIDSHLAVLQSVGQILYGLTDAIDSTIATTNQLGVAATGFVYDAFGQTGPTPNSYPFLFAGRTLTSANLYYNRARFYNSQTGRFIVEDPLFTGNPYRYAANNPTLYGDPTGLFTLFLGGTGSTVAVQGDEAGAGVYFHFGGDGFSAGLYGSSGPGGGLNVGAGITGGFVVGSLQNFTGKFTNITVSKGVGPISSVGLTASWNCANQFAGLSFSYELSPPVPYGISVSQTNTGIQTFSQILNSLANRVGSWTIQLNPSGPYN